MWYGLLADLLVALHAGYVGVVVFGLLAILLGRPLGWRWVRNRWFRAIHFTMIAVVALEAIGGYDCPLTTWENQLRALAGQPVQEGTFVGRLMHALIFLNLPAPVFNVLHVSFALLVLATFWITPVNWRPAQAQPASPEADPAPLTPGPSPSRGRGEAARFT